MIFPWIIIVLGVIFLLQNLNILPPGFWGYIWPIILIAVGLAMLNRRSGNCGAWFCGQADHRSSGQKPSEEE